MILILRNGQEIEISIGSRPPGSRSRKVAVGSSLEGAEARRSAPLLVAAAARLASLDHRGRLPGEGGELTMAKPAELEDRS